MSKKLFPVLGLIQFQSSPKAVAKLPSFHMLPNVSKGYPLPSGQKLEAIGNHPAKFVKLPLLFSHNCCEYAN
jgi:hypothetical protein